jgi:hypothetical protein
MTTPVVSVILTVFERGRPVILIEIRERNKSQVRRLLESFGYRRIDLEQIVDVSGSPEDFIFFPY